MKFEKIGIVGQGFVGTAVREGLQNYFTILTHDKNGKCSNTLEEVVTRSKVIFLCLPTPMTREGKCHTGIIESVLDQINPICDEMEYFGSRSVPVTLQTNLHASLIEHSFIPPKLITCFEALESTAAFQNGSKQLSI